MGPGLGDEVTSGTRGVGLLSGALRLTHPSPHAVSSPLAFFPSLVPLASLLLFPALSTPFLPAQLSGFSLHLSYPSRIPLVLPVLLIPTPRKEVVPTPHPFSGSQLLPACPKTPQLRLSPYLPGASPVGRERLNQASLLLTHRDLK